jgi:hypothetical protein
MNASRGARGRLRERQPCAKGTRHEGARNAISEQVGGRSGARCGAVRADSGAVVVDQYVERALHARSAQGLPATIEDRETLDKLALLMAATKPAEAAETPATVSDATDQGEVTGADASALPRQPRQRHRPNVGRPRPGANQTGAGSFTTQHVAGYGEDATLAARTARRGGAS